jgi:hypothetical protein
MYVSPVDEIIPAFACPTCGLPMHLLFSEQNGGGRRSFYVCTFNLCPCPEHGGRWDWPIEVLRARVTKRKDVHVVATPFAGHRHHRHAGRGHRH